MELKENKHYEIIPDHTDDQAWNVRVLAGPFTETVIKYGTIKFNEIPKNMTFNFNIVYSPDNELTTDNFELQDFAGAMLEKIISNGIKDKSVITKEIVDAD